MSWCTAPRTSSVVGIDDVGRAEALRHLAAFGDRIGDDDRGRSRDAGALHDRDADATRADDEHRRALGHARGVEHRADAGLHRAPDHARDVERRVGVDLDRAGLGGDDVLREPTEADAAQHGQTLTRQRRAAVDERARTDRDRVDAAAVLAAHAPVARVAHGDRREHDLVAGHDRRDAGTDRVDDTRGLVPEHGRRDERERAVHEREVGVTDAAVRDPHPAPHRRGGLRCRRRRRSRAASPTLRARLHASANRSPCARRVSLASVGEPWTSSTSGSTSSPSNPPQQFVTQEGYENIPGYLGQQPGPGRRRLAARDHGRARRRDRRLHRRPRSQHRQAARHLRRASRAASSSRAASAIRRGPVVRSSACASSRSTPRSAWCASCRSRRRSRPTTPATTRSTKCARSSGSRSRSTPASRGRACARGVQHPELLEDVLIDFPDLTVIVAHMGHPYEELLMNYMRKWSNLYLSCTAYAPRYMDPNLVAFMNTKTYRGRVLWGSDEPWFPMRRSLTEAQAPAPRRRGDGVVPRRNRPPAARPDPLTVIAVASASCAGGRDRSATASPCAAVRSSASPRRTRRR